MLPTLAELRRLEDHLDWLENQRPPKHRRLSLAPVLLPIAALATALWLRKPDG